MRKTAHGQGAIYASGIVECLELVDALLAGLPGAGEDDKETDAEWRYRWHRRLGRSGLETEGKFYERIDAILSARSAPPAEGGPTKDTTSEKDLAQRYRRLTGPSIDAWDSLWPLDDDQRREMGNMLASYAAMIVTHHAHEFAASAPRAEPPTVGQWQPIATAPKNGTVIIGALISGSGKVWRVHEMAHNGLAFYTVAGGSLPNMTHWIALPPAPVPEETT